jgi:hypothetical protein
MDTPLTKMKASLDKLQKNLEHAERLSRSDNLQGFEAESLAAVIGDALATTKEAQQILKNG